MARKVRAPVRAGRASAQRGTGRGTAPADATHALQARVDGLVAELRAVNEELEAFSYSVSHDLRAPMRHIHGFLRLLEDELGAPSPKAAHYMETVAGAAKRMGALIDDLLAYSRIARVPLEPQRIDLGAEVREIVGRYALEVGGPKVAWSIGELPWVSADRGQLRIVLRHLLSNARKFTRGGSQPHVEVRAQDGPQGAVEISVRDNGIGFDPRHASRLFGVFQRLYGDEQMEGNGIGLAMSRRILHRHGQRIWAEGAPGAGAVFTFTLPRAERA
jgi:signal transduction histidine kinase